MGKDLDRPIWRGQRPWFEIWFAVILDTRRRRALWIRQTMFVPRTGQGRATIWGAWFDADAPQPSRAAKRYHPLEQSAVGVGDALIRIDDSSMSRARGDWLGRRPRVGRELDRWARGPRRCPGVAARAHALATDRARCRGHRPRHHRGSGDRASRAARSRCTCGASAASPRCTGSTRRGSGMARSRSPRSRCATRSRSASRRLRLDGPDARGRPPRHRRASQLPGHLDGRRRTRASCTRARGPSPSGWSATRIATPTIAI